MADVVSAWLSMIDEELPLIIERLREVQIVNGDGIDVIRRWDSPDTLFYCDPPYVSETRASPDVYDCEMDDEAHRELAEVLKSCKGKVVLSGYRSTLYDELYGGIADNVDRHPLPCVGVGGHGDEARGLVVQRRGRLRWERMRLTSRISFAIHSRKHVEESPSTSC